MKSRRWILTGIGAGLALAWLAARALAYQGMATPNVRPSKQRISTDLPLIHPDFRDVAAAAGLNMVHVSGGVESKKYIIETTGSGVAVFDFDNDGLMDLFLVNGTALDETGSSTNHLYRNLGKLKFEDVTAKSGLTHNGWGQGVCAGDYDNDGNSDLFVTYYGHSRLYHNRGNGTFEDVTSRAGLQGSAVRWDGGCSFLDYDLDGKLDLVVTGYVEFDRSKVPAPGSGGYCQWKGMPVMCGPRGLPAGTNQLFHNEGGGSFKDVSAPSGVGAKTGCYGFTAIASDFDNDGYPDIYVACDSTPSLLYHNRKDGTFEEIGVASGVALNEDGQEQAGMGVAAADYDEDGHIDLIKTNFSDDAPNVYHNNGDGTFTDLVHRSGLSAHTQYLGWGILFADVDHDGRKDIIVINGHVYPEIDKANLPSKYRQPRLLYWNVGDGKFVDLSDTSGPGMRETWSSRGAAAGDLDNDGSLEIVVNNLGSRPSLLKNFTPARNWLLVRAQGVKCNRDAVGARVYVYAGGRRLSGEVQTGSSFLSQNDPRLHFGLADAGTYDRIEIKWPGGQRERFPGGKANRILTLKEGAGSPADR